MREKEEEGGAKRPTKQTIMYFFLVINGKGKRSTICHTSSSSSFFEFL